MDIWDIVFLPIKACLSFPPLAIIIGLAFFAISRVRAGSRGASITAAVLWIVYGGYECYMTWIWSPAHIAPIRADLFLIAFGLYLISLYTIISLLSCLKDNNSK